ncbi:PREDICTED: CSC1-like protein ERD4 [Ipomoea nil]|uniref:CSC1-like protein ERD4 n=1 Tax=Ipomoea nil TaxID=35883 RepID=UPI000900D840|nr:PREDICTED: CSC1-like protein ERD4 [Ipomoea nil]
MDSTSFFTSLGTSFVIFVVLMLLFVLLLRKPGNAVVYYPNRILKGLDPVQNGYVSRNPFLWIREALSSSQADIIRMSGVDTAVYFVFLTTALGIMVFSGFILLPTLLPVAATDHSVRSNNNTREWSFNDLDKFAMGHVGERSLRLWAFIIATYWVSFVAYYFLWEAYKHVVDLRVEALMSSEDRAEQFAVLVRDIPPVPKGESRKEQVDSYFSRIYPETFYRSMLVTNNREVNKIYEELVGYKKMLERAEAIYARSKETTPDGPKPTHKTGLFGILGEKVDSIEFYNEKINDLTSKLEAEQKVTLKEKQECSAIIFFNSRLTAASAPQSLHFPMADKWTVTYAPEPRQLIWANLPTNFYERIIRRYVIYTIVFVTIFFYMIPIGMVSALTTLSNLREQFPFLKPIVDQPTIKTVLEAYLPQLALIIFLALLPKFLLFLSKAEGIPSQSHATRAASGKYFYFIVLNVFIGVTVGSTLFDTLKSLQHKSSIVSLLGKSLPGSATFFLTYVAMKFFVGYGLELSRIVPLIMFHLKRKYMCETDAELKEAWSPGDLGYETRFPKDMLILTICLCYSVITPLIIPFGAVYFGFGWLVLRNQALKVYVPSFESYGQMWLHMHMRVVAALILYQLTMIGYFGVKKFYYTPLLIPLPILSFIYAFVCNKKFYRFFQSTALEVVPPGELKEVSNMEIIFNSFIPPCLDGSAVKSHSEDALSQFSRSASNV